VQFWAKTEIVAQVSRRDFSPSPKVDSAVIVLNTKIFTGKPTLELSTHASAACDLNPTLYYRAVRAIFAQPRKTLLNNLSTAAGKTVKKDDVSAQIKKIGIDPGARPQDLDIDQIASIASMDLWE
jgi:16S rRNA (adenine1518-N6/adenine1519-N6)-dimethyltransferase